MAMRILITNDDGIKGGFIKTLVEGLCDDYELFVAAPSTEKSWIGRAITRHQSIGVTQIKTYPCLSWSIDGTPSDCVNLALSYLLPCLPDLVLSGVNIGYNTTLPLVMSSGTVAGAFEGSSFGVPSVAASSVVPHEMFAQIKANGDRVPAEFQPHLDAVVSHLRDYLPEIKKSERKRFQVDNINYPFPMTETTELRKTRLADIQMGSLFVPDDDDESKYVFRFHPGKPIDESIETDRGALAHGFISHTLIDFNELKKF